MGDDGSHGGILKPYLLSWYDGSHGSLLTRTGGRYVRGGHYVVRILKNLIISQIIIIIIILKIYYFPYLMI